MYTNEIIYVLKPIRSETLRRHIRICLGGKLKAAANNRDTPLNKLKVTEIRLEKALRHTEKCVAKRGGYREVTLDTGKLGLNLTFSQLVFLIEKQLKRGHGNA